MSVTYKVILLGSSTVGKTSIGKRLRTGEFELPPITVGVDFHFHSVKLDNGHEVTLQIWDTAGQERYQNITRSFYRDAHGVVYVYDVTNSISFEELRFWHNRVNEHVASVSGSLVAILLGNKNDMTEKKVISKSHGEHLKDCNTWYEFYEVSAKTGENLKKAFKQLALHLVDTYNNSLKDLSALSSIEQKSKEPVNANPFNNGGDGRVKLEAADFMAPHKRNTCSCSK